MSNKNSLEGAKLAYLALDDKLAEDIRVLDISNVSSMGDYFIIADGSNKNQVQALCDSVEEKLHIAGAELKNREGSSNGGWLLLDYYDIIIHVFSEKERSFYDLDHIWRDGALLQPGEY